MINPTLERELHSQLEILRPAAQRQVLEFAKALALSTPRPMKKQDLLDLGGTISPEDLKLMADAIEEGCGKVDENGW